MTHVKLLVIVTSDRERRRLLEAWRERLVGPHRLTPEAALLGAQAPSGPVSFGRIDVREGLSLYLFIADGGWRREYVCQVLASQVAGYCLIVGPEPGDLTLGRDLLALLRATTDGPGIVAATDAQDPEATRAALALPLDLPLARVDCGRGPSADDLVCGLLEHLAAVPAA